MTFRYIVPAIAVALLAGVASAPVSAAPIQKAVLAHENAQITLVDQRDGRWRGDRDRGRDRHYRGRDHDRRYSRGGYYRPYYPPYRPPPRYVYGPPPSYYAPYEPYYPYSYFNYSSPSFGFSLGY